MSWRSSRARAAARRGIRRCCSFTGAAHGAWCWADHFLGFLADRGFDAYALSLRGHGKSGGRERLRWTSLADYVDDVERVAAGLPREPVVVGHSMGGMVAAQYLARRRPAAAGLLAPAPPGGMPRQWARLSFDNPWLTLEMLLTPGGRQDVLHAGARQEVPLLARAGRGGVAPPCGATRARVDSRRPGTELAAARPRPLRRHPAAGAGRGARLHHPAERSRAHRGRLRRRVANPAGHRARPDAGHGLAPGGRRAAGVACRNPLPEARIQPPSDAWGAPGPSVPSARPARARCPGDWARPQASAAAPRWCPT